MNDKLFRKYCSFSIFLSLLGMFELEAKEEEEKEEKKTERKKEKNAQHTLGKVTTQAAKIFNYNNQTTISSKELERRQANQISDMFRRNPNINVGGGAVIAQKFMCAVLKTDWLGLQWMARRKWVQAMGIKAIRSLTLECLKAWWLLRGRLKRARGLWL